MSNENHLELSIEGMSCASCVRHVEEALSGLDGVEKVEVTLAEGRARVAYDASRATLDAMIRALDEAGYPSRPRLP